jgi:hypothetical protein
MSRIPSSDDSRFAPTSVPGWATTLSPAEAAMRPVVRFAPTSAADPELRQRQPQRRSLTDAAHVWLARLPPRFQPLCTARLHPHIVNRMAELWATPEQLPAYFNELLLSPREGRRGFAFEVLTELFDLQSLLNTRH